MSQRHNLPLRLSSNGCLTHRGRFRLQAARSHRRHRKAVFPSFAGVPLPHALSAGGLCSSNLSSQPGPAFFAASRGANVPRPHAPTRRGRRGGSPQGPGARRIHNAEADRPTRPLRKLVRTFRQTGHHPRSGDLQSTRAKPAGTTAQIEAGPPILRARGPRMTAPPGWRSESKKTPAGVLAQCDCHSCRQTQPGDAYGMLRNWEEFVCRPGVAFPQRSRGCCAASGKL